MMAMPGQIQTPMADDQSVARLFLRQREMLMSYIRALVRDLDDAEDLFQEVGVRVLHLERLPCDPDRFAAWCRGVARNLVLHYWRSRRRSPVVADSRLLDAIDAAYSEADPRAEQLARRGAALAECVGQLPERQRRVLSLRYASRMTSEEIGALLIRSAAAVRQELARMRHQLLDCAERRLAKGVDFDG
jgi:RNA polymerase sigma-70 factor (ECF subfamily)